jgi:hypothetical protein
LKPKSIKLKPKPAVGIKRTGVDPNAPAGSKRSTSKISLTNANSVAPVDMAAGTPKTISIKPSPATGDDTTGTSDVKRQTSRISLESALGADSNAPASGPKTIRLKRPGKTPTVNTKGASDDKNLSKTAKLELPAEESGVPDTQKKTIKVKRPSQRRVKKTMSVKRGGGKPAAAGTEGQAAEAASGEGDAQPSIPIAPLQSLTPAVKPDKVHWTFIVSAVAATIMICVMIYVLCAQVLGPNISYTELSYGAPTVELPWPGRISSTE